MNERAKARLDWKFEVAFGLLEVFDTTSFRPMRIFITRVLG
jgi:hypothetical protein